jgi:hypothetical protein
LARDHAPVTYLESNHISVLAFDEELRLQPSLSHRAVDEVPLDPFAFRASKRSQVLAQRARSIAVSFIGEPQAVHCGPWLCLSSMPCSPQFGALSSPASQPAAFDFKGSDAVTLIST